ncbi:MAG: MTH938/NDUFAF3 family protein [Sphingomonas sp.]
MRIEHETTAQGPLIKGFSGGGFRVDDNVYLGLVITPNRADGWSPPPVEALDVMALTAALAIDPLPEFIILGTGTALVRPPAALVSALEARGVGIEAMDSRAAARVWGVLRTEGRWITAALYPL